MRGMNTVSVAADPKGPKFYKGLESTVILISDAMLALIKLMCYQECHARP